MINTFKKIWQEILNNTKVTLLTHVSPDGDTTGSAYALKHLILDNTKDIEVKISGQPVPSYLSSIDENDNVDDGYFNNSLKIVVDTSSKRRIFDQRVVTKESIKIDHHHKEEEWLLEIGGDHWPATGEVMYELADQLNLKMNKEFMTGIFIAIWTDTEGMTQRNFTKRTKEILSLLDIDKDKIIDNIKPSSEVAELVEYFKPKLIVEDNLCTFIDEKVVDDDDVRLITKELSNIKECKVYCGILKTNENSYRGSLRSKDGTDVSSYAKKYGGGGHASSAGFRANSYEEATKYLEDFKKSIKKH